MTTSKNHPSLERAGFGPRTEHQHSGLRDMAKGGIALGLPLRNLHRRLVRKILRLRDWELRGDAATGDFLTPRGAYRGVIEFTTAGFDVWVLGLPSGVARHSEHIRPVGNGTYQIEIPERLQKMPLKAIVHHCEEVVRSCIERQAAMSIQQCNMHRLSKK